MQSEGKILVAPVLVVLIGFTTWHYSTQPIGDYGGLLNSEDCDVSENFYIGVEENTYYPSNETAILELNRTGNLTSEYLEKLKISVRGGEVEGNRETRIKVNGNISEEGIIAEEKTGLGKNFGRSEL